MAPKLVTEFGNDVEGAIIEEPFTAPDDPSLNYTKQWIRIKIRNDGKSTTRKVRVMIVDISNKATQTANWAFQEEAIDCNWSHIDSGIVAIPRDNWRFSDTACLNRTNQGGLRASTGV